MDLQKFKNILQSYGFGDIEISESLSDIAAVLWCNDYLSIQIASDRYGEPYLSIVISAQDEGFLFFSGALSEAGPAGIKELLQYACENPQCVHDQLLQVGAGFDLKLPSGRNLRLAAQI